jgi:hypothetical protein
MLLRWLPPAPGGPDGPPEAPAPGQPA